jgi:two-component system response regulator AtoC
MDFAKHEMTKAIAATDQTVLITGATGTGKSRLAQEIHLMSPRRERRFATITLPTLSENLIESELFGHERGAFSGADQKRIGRLEYANGGTVFLDEIGEIPLHIQAKLLEALNSKTIVPIGGNREVQLDVRIIAATNRNLVEMMKRGEFREDLYFRLNLFNIQLPTLTEVPETILPLTRKFAALSAREQGKEYGGLTNEYEKSVMEYGWPGNARELKNAVAYGVALSRDGKLSTEFLPPYIGARSATVPPKTNVGAGDLAPLFHLEFHESKKRFETLYLREILRKQNGKINQTARVAGLSKVTLIEKIRRYGIDVEEIKYGCFKTSRAPAEHREKVPAGSESDSKDGNAKSV